MSETCRKAFDNYSATSSKPFGETSRKPSRKLIGNQCYSPAKTTSQYYCVLQSSHKLFPSTTLHYKARTKTLQYYCILQSLHKHVPVLPYTTQPAQTSFSTTVNYKARTKSLQYYHIMLQNSLQYYRIPQNMPEHVPVLPYTAKLAQSRPSSTV